MPRWLWWAPLGILLVVLALYGFRLGWIASRITETDVINAYAARYVSEVGPGADIEDCVARPGGSLLVWIVVRCEPRGTAEASHFEYHVNRLGGLMRSGAEPSEQAMEGPRI